MVSNSGCSCARKMNFFCFLGFWGQESHSNYCICATFTRDLENEVHVMVYVTFLSLLWCFLPRWFLCCFVRYLGLEIHFNYRRLRDHHAWPWNWKSRFGLREFCYFCLYLSYRDDLFCFVRLLVQWIHSNYCQLRDLYAWSWKPKVMLLPTWLFDLSGC